jgi:hypothetical protein
LSADELPGDFPQGLKPNVYAALTARLKPCPFKAAIFQYAAKACLFTAVFFAGWETCPFKAAIFQRAAKPCLFTAVFFFADWEVCIFNAVDFPRTGNGASSKQEFL